MRRITAGSSGSGSYGVWLETKRGFVRIPYGLLEPLHTGRCSEDSDLPFQYSPSNEVAESFETEAKEKLFLPSHQQMARLPAAAGGPT